MATMNRIKVANTVPPVFADPIALRSRSVPGEIVWFGDDTTDMIRDSGPSAKNDRSAGEPVDMRQTRRVCYWSRSIIDALPEAAAEPIHFQTTGTRPPAMRVMPFPTDVGVAVICHNNLDKLKGTLRSLDAAGCPRSSMLIVDVASTDGTVAWLRGE